MPLQDLIKFIERIRASDPRRDWTPELPPEPHTWDRAVRTCPVPAWRADDAMEYPTPLSQARADLRRELSDYQAELSPDYMLLVCARPGTGKTQAAAELIDRLIDEGHRIAYAGPRHDFFVDVTAKSADPSRWYEWRPRQAGDDERGKPETCKYPVQISTWMNRGYEPMNFCSGVCGWDYVKICPFHVQKNRNEPVIFVQHQHIALGHPMSFDVVIGDENPIGAFLRDWEIPARWVMPPGMDAETDAAEIFNRLADLCGRTPRDVSGPELIDGLGGPEHVIEALGGYEIPTDALAMVPPIHQASDADDAPYFHLPTTASLLVREARVILEHGDCIHRAIVLPGSLHLLTRRKAADILPAHVIWLDATGRPEIYERLFGRRVRVVYADPELHGRIHQVTDRANGKTQIKPSKAWITGENKRRKKPLGDDYEPPHAAQAKLIIERVIAQRGYKHASIISYMGLDTKDIDAKTGHFFAARGTNAHETADAVFILGTPQPSIYEIIKAAKMIYFERDEPFNTAWYPRDSEYNYQDADGLGRCFPTSGFWNDADLNSVLFASREDEIIQAAHRGRPVNHITDIWLFSNLPIRELPPTELITMREIMDAPPGVNIWKWSKIVELMETLDAITIADIEATGVNHETAAEYLKLISDSPGWEMATIRTGKRGNPPKTAVKGNGI